MNTLNNELIAGFMNVQKVMKGRWSTHYFTEWVEDGLDYPELRYDTSWDWLMPVVTKIFSLDVTPSEERSSINDALNDAHLPTLYVAVVDFIKWYNRVEGR
jgi:hypothetical protein